MNQLRLRTTTIPPLLCAWFVVGCGGGYVPTPAQLVLEVGDRDCVATDVDCISTFEPVVAGSTSVRTFLLQNIGDKDADIAGASITGDPAFAIAQDFRGTLAGRDAAAITLTATPLGAHEIEGMLVVDAEDPAESIDVRLFATGLLRPNDVSATGCDFGDVPLQTTAGGCTLVIRNSTVQSLVIESVSVTPPFALASNIMASLPVEVEPASGLPVSISATPTVLGVAEGVVELGLSGSSIVQAVSVNGI